MASSMRLNATCLCCLDPATLTCAECNAVRYCSRECQETEWPAHKWLCKQWKECRGEEDQNEKLAEAMDEVSVLQSQGSEMKRVIYFPINGAPRFVWLPVKTCFDEEGEVEFQQPEMGCLMEGTEFPEYDFVVGNAITGLRRWGKERIHLCYLDPEDDETASVVADAGDDGEEASTTMRNTPNLAVRHATDDLACYPWIGPLLAFSGYTDSEARDADITQVIDMDMESFSFVAAHLAAKDNDSHSFLALLGPKVEAVEIVCDAEMEVDGRDRFETVTIPRIHPLMRGEGEVSEISQMIEMPLALVKFRTDASLLKPNTVASAILSHISLDPNDNVGFPDQCWDDSGNVLIFHERFHPALDLDTVKAFAAYCKMISRNMQQAMACADINEAGKKFMEAHRFAGSGEQTHKEDWEWYFEKWKAEKAKVEGAKDSVVEEEGDVDVVREVMELPKP